MLTPLKQTSKTLPFYTTPSLPACTCAFTHTHARLSLHSSPFSPTLSTLLLEVSPVPFYKHKRGQKPLQSRFVSCEGFSQLKLLSTSAPTANSISPRVAPGLKFLAFPTLQKAFPHPFLSPVALKIRPVTQLLQGGFCSSSITIADVGKDLKHTGRRWMGVNPGLWVTFLPDTSPVSPPRVPAALPRVKKLSKTGTKVGVCAAGPAVPQETKLCPCSP